MSLRGTPWRGGIADEPEPNKIKSKTSHGARLEPDESSEEESSAAVHSASGPVSKRWYPNGLKFPCPLDNHKHETVACTQFFGLCPKERFLRIERRKVCWTCMKPKDVCVGRSVPTTKRYQRSSYAQVVLNLQKQKDGLL